MVPYHFCMYVYVDGWMNDSLFYAKVISASSSIHLKKSSKNLCNTF